VAILQRSAREPIGLLADVLDARGLDWQHFRLEGEPDVPDPAEIAFAVAIGSDASGDAARPSSGRTEVDWLRRLDAAGASILGIGSGAQTLALALGGGIEWARRPQHGWAWVETAEPDLVARGPWLAWHDHEILLPTEAELLAHNASGPQAFRLRRHLGIHFHPEVTPEILGGWVLGSNRRDLDTQGILEAALRDANTTATNAYQLFAAFIASGDLLT
jgi:GMP synthase-like glutamine amidotransferase